MFAHDPSDPWMTAQQGQRVIGVVFDPRHDSGNCVPTRLAGSYDALPGSRKPPSSPSRVTIPARAVAAHHQNLCR